MKRTHLGDSIDIWKRGMIGYLRDARAIGHLEVVPMMTDARAWTTDELASYAAILGIPTSSLLGTGRFMQSGRRQYFESIAVSADVFVDPDNGVADPATKAVHVSPVECGRLLTRNPPNVVMVYQHAQRSDSWAKSQIGLLQNALPGIHACAYQSSVVGMLFLSRGADRIRKVRSALADLLGPAAHGTGEFPTRVVG